MTGMGGPRGPDHSSARLGPRNGLAEHRARASRALAAMLCRNADECEDLVQDTFERALRHLAGAHEPVRNTRAWLVAILRNVFIDRVRAERATTADVDDCEAPEPDPQPAWADVSLGDVRAACEALDPICGPSSSCIIWTGCTTGRSRPGWQSRRTPSRVACSGRARRSGISCSRSE